MTGLTNEQVQERIAEGKVNVNENPNTRTYKQIILENTLTFFNFLNIALLVLVLFVRSYKNSMFMGIILINTVIGIIQEIRAKKTIDKLAILTESKTVVLREGKKWSISTEKLVLDDLIFLKTGDQVPADVKVLEGTVEVNESLLTGESDNLSKSQGDELFSGSFVTSGEACCQVIHVGKDNYASQITSEAKEFKRHNSELRNSLNAILKVISIIIVPLGAMLFYKQYMIVGDTLKDSVVNMVAAVLGMIPEGLVLLTSVALTLGSMVLATKKTLVQELYCIETLARVDTLCLDKTGTITEGTMKVEDVQLYDTAQTTVVQHTAKFDPETGEPVQNVSALKPEVTVSAEKENGQIQETVNLETVSQEERQKLQEIDHIMGNMMSVLHDQNATADALRKRFPSRNDLKLIHAIPFSSDRKYSGAVFEGRGTYLMGAAQFLFPEGNEELLEHCSSYAQEGYRILVLAHSEQETKGTERPTGLEPLGLFLITDVIREEAPDTLAFFDSQGVDLKVISGDDPVTVSAIAKKAGLKNANHYIDATTIKTPEEMQAKVADWDTFWATAKEVYDASGNKTAMADTLGGVWRAYSAGNRSTAWVQDGKITADNAKACLGDFINMAKTNYDAGYIGTVDQWTDDWYAIGQADGAMADATMGYFFPSWSLAAGGQLESAEGGESGSTYGKYAITEGPTGWFWGGSWICVSPNCDNGTFAGQFIKAMTVDDATMKEYCESHSDFVNNKSVMKEVVDGGKNSNPLFKDGQDQFAVLYNSADAIDLDGIATQYDGTINTKLQDAVTAYCKGDLADEQACYDEFLDTVASAISDITVE